MMEAKQFKKVPEWWHHKKKFKKHTLITIFSVEKINICLHNNNNNGNNSTYSIIIAFHVSVINSSKFIKFERVYKS